MIGQRLATAAALTCALAALVPAGTALAREKPPVMLERDGAWVVNYDPDSCSAAGAFGTADQRTIIRMTWFEPSDEFQLLFSGKWLPGGTSNPIDITFGPESATQHTETINGTNGEAPIAVVSSTRLNWLAKKPVGEPPKVTPEQEKAVGWLELRLAGGTRRRLVLHGMGPLMATVRTCTRDLVKTWGFDPAAQAALTSRPEALNEPGSWLHSSDYPGTALMRGENGLVRFRLDIDGDGHVGGCHVLKGIQAPSFEKITCDLIRRRARFKPALDPNGKTAPSFYVNTVRWIMAS